MSSIDISINFKHIIAFCFISATIAAIFTIFALHTKHKDESDMITKKDLTYWVIILSIVLVSMFSLNYYDVTNFSDYFSFASTITSILLGVIAIIYSLFQSFDNAVTQNSLTKNLDALEAVASKLEDLMTSISEMDVAKSVSEVKQVTSEISCSFNKIQSDLSSIIDNTHDTKEKVQTLYENRYANNSSNISVKNPSSSSSSQDLGWDGAGSDE